MHLNNKTGRPIRLNYLNTSCLDRILEMDARLNRTSRDVEKSLNKDKLVLGLDVPIPGPEGPGGNLGVKYENEHER